MKTRSILLAVLLAMSSIPVLADDCPAGTSWCSGLYRYDGMGNIRAIGSDVYIYDTAGRLVSGTAEAQRGGTSRQDYGYDTFGNRTSASRITGSADCLGGCEQSPTIDAGTNHITSNGALYDAAGNLIAIQNTVNNVSYTSAYVYDAVGSLARATAGSDDRQFIYTADDERIATRNGQSWTWTVRDLDNKVLREFTSVEPNGQPGLPTSSRQWAKDYVWRDGLLLVSVTPTTPGANTTLTEHFHLDHLGTPRLVSNDAGFRIGIHAYYPFGAELNLAPNETPAELMKFTGHERDLLASNPNTPDYMHARYEMGTMGRFLSIDPELNVKSAIHKPQKWNRYAYVVNSPILYLDPTGRQEAAGFAMDRDVQDLLTHRIDEKTYWARLNARGVGAAAGAAFWASVLYGPEAISNIGQGALGFGRAAIFQLKILASGTTSIMLGQTMSRVQNAADETGSLTFETDATELQTMWQQNKAWLDAAIKAGYKIFDIGGDPNKLNPGTFHPMEEQYLIDQGFYRIHAGLTFVHGELVEVFQWVQKTQ
jgi:RHS repeat-associated protein